MGRTRPLLQQIIMGVKINLAKWSDALLETSNCFSLILLPPPHSLRAANDAVAGAGVSPGEEGLGGCPRGASGRLGPAPPPEPASPVAPTLPPGPPPSPASPSRPGAPLRPSAAPGAGPRSSMIPPQASPAGREEGTPSPCTPTPYPVSSAPGSPVPLPHRHKDTQKWSKEADTQCTQIDSPRGIADGRGVD